MSLLGVDCIYMCILCIFLWGGGGGISHLLSFPSHLPVILLQLVVERLATRHQVLSADLTRSLLPHRLVALDVVLLLLFTVGGGGEGVKVEGREKK